MLTCCFDASGKETEKYRLMAVAGFAGFASCWKEFEDGWSRRLKQDGLPYFHAKSFAHFRGPFRTEWKDNEPRRISLGSDLMSIIQESGLRKFGTVLKLDDFKRSRDRRKLELDAFAYCAMDVVKACTAFAHTEGIRDNVRYVFEKGDPEDHLTKWFRECGYSDPDFAWSSPHTDDKGVEPVLGLQAADWLAYEYYLDANRLLYHTSTDRWALKQFETVQGHIMLRYESVAPNLPDAKAIFESVMNATSRLSKIKEEAEEGESPTVEPTAEMLKTPGPEAKA